MRRRYRPGHFTTVITRAGDEFFTAKVINTEQIIALRAADFAIKARCMILAKLCVRKLAISFFNNHALGQLLHFKEPTIDDLLFAVITKVMAEGERVKVTRGWTRELYGVLLKLDNPLARLSLTESRGKIFSCLGELFWYLSGTASLDYIKHYIPAYVHDSEDGATIHGGYGPRIFDAKGNNQLANVISLLSQKPRSRRAVIQIFDASDLAKPRKEIPCTATLQFIMPNNKLTLIVNMRSNDAVLGLPHDVFAFTMLQEIVARSLGVDVGKYIHFAGSMHIYEDKFDKANEYLREGYQELDLAMPPMPVGDPWQSINVLKEAEKTARKEGKQVDSVGDLDPYWQDIARMFRVFAASKKNDEFLLRGLSSQMHNQIYSQYIDVKIEKASKRSGHQGFLI